MNAIESKTILLIEDNSDLLDNLTEYLELEGYKILGASNGRTGVEFAMEFIPDLIICDILMPAMDGYQVLRLLAEASATCQIPFIFSTSMSEKAHKTKALGLGADAYILKPYDMEELLKLAKKWIRSGSSRLLNKPPTSSSE